MKKPIYTTLVALLSLIISCQGQQSNNAYLNQVNKLIPEELRTHLPSRIGTDEFKIYPNINPNVNKFEGEHVCIYLYFKPKNQYFDSLKLRLKDSSIGSYKFNDSCNIVIYNFQEDMGKSSFIGREWLYEEWLKKLDSCDEDRIPIPNFIEIGNGTYKYKKGISPDYILYVTSSGKGKKFSDKYYSGPIPLPEKWERGYSQGYALNSKTREVIYWFSI